MSGIVAAVSSSGSHTLAKPNQEKISGCWLGSASRAMPTRAPRSGIAPD